MNRSTIKTWDEINGILDRLREYTGKEYAVIQTESRSPRYRLILHWERRVGEQTFPEQSLASPMPLSLQAMCAHLNILLDVAVGAHLRALGH